MVSGLSCSSAQESALVLGRHKSLFTGELVWAVVTGGHWTGVPRYRWACLSHHYRWTLDRSPSLQVSLSELSLQVNTGQESLITGELVWAIVMKPSEYMCFWDHAVKLLGPKTRSLSRKKAKKDFLHCLANVGECWWSMQGEVCCACYTVFLCIPAACHSDCVAVYTHDMS